MKHEISIKHLNKGQYRELLCLLLQTDWEIGKWATTKYLEKRCIELGYLRRKNE